MTQNGYFRLANKVALGMGTSDGTLIFCYVISAEITEKKNSSIEYNNRMVCDCFNIIFTADFGSPALNIPPITIDVSYTLNISSIAHKTRVGNIMS